MATSLELIAWLREMLDDEVQPYLWTNSYLVRALNDAEEQACRRAYVLIDKDTASVCQLTLSASVGSFTYHSRILQIRRITIGSADYPLKQALVPELDEACGAWWSVQGVPENYVIETQGRIIFYPMPQSLDTATMEVARLPLNSMNVSGSCVPEIPEMYHRDLLIWGKRVAYLKPDSDTFNKELADAAEQEFTARFGPLPSAKEERLRKLWPRSMGARPREFGT
jgi:hypothetical protein